MMAATAAPAVFSGHRAALAAPAPAEDMEVDTWLASISKPLAVYAPQFIEEGYENLEMLKELEEQR